MSSYADFKGVSVVNVPVNAPYAPIVVGRYDHASKEVVYESKAFIPQDISEDGRYFSIGEDVYLAQRKS